MASDGTNKGIIQHGGSIQAGQLAVGDRATNVRSGDDVATIDQETLRLVLHRLDALAAAAAQAPAPAQASLAAATTQLAAELEKPAPSKSRLKGFLDTLGEIGKTVTALGPAVQAVVKVVGLVL